MTRIVAITGATGFAGRHAVSELLGHGLRLRALVRNPKGAELPPEVELVAGDLADEAALDRLCEGADAVLHLAGALTALDPMGYVRVNELGTISLLDAACRRGVKRFVHISSLAAREPEISPYAASKFLGEEALRQRQDEIEGLIIRPPAVYGPGDRGTLPLIKELTKSFAAIPGPATARFSLIHARDLARLIARALAERTTGLEEVSDGKAGGYGWADLLRVASDFRGTPVKAFFLPRAIPATVAGVAEAVARLTGKPGMINRGKIAELYHPDWVVRDGRLRLPDPIPFAEGFAETVNWYRNAGWLPVDRRADRRAPQSRTLS